MAKHTLVSLLKKIEYDNIILSNERTILRVIAKRSDPKYYGLYIAYNKGKYICCDNTDGNAWTEEFTKIDDAIEYLINKDYIPF